ncbi:MAG: cysteine-rich KTR domain-containing protein [Blautia sp.]|uniref:cysteine-rich KTR domain-containing protein n=1 Tax=Blautia sp. TaxID=1955243 RepID=UPI0025BEEB57|nr:cysteine-rich KTR domain-containing protein [Blautia sp.]MCI7449741.1 cysteine-rich KTR domain-containing protein [Blautia sp.]MDD6415265.1 cysteine-rich KTR domain-containing protein [Blautia sp.]
MKNLSDLSQKYQLLFQKFLQDIRCPVCNNKTRVQIRNDTELRIFPLFCPKCRQVTLINVIKLNIEIIKEPAAQTQSR